MADLTAYTQDPSFYQAGGGKRIVDPGPATPNPVGELANAGAGLVGGFGDFERSMLAIGDRQAQNATVQAVTDNLNRLQQQVTSQQPAVQQAPQGTPLPAQAQQAVQSVADAQKAEANGNLPVGAAQLHMETTFNNLLAQFPNQKNVIYEQFQRMGMYSQVNQDAQRAVAMADTQYETAAKNQVMYADTAYKSGQLPPNATWQDAVNMGQKLTGLAFQRSIAEAQVDYATKVATLDKDRYGYQKEVAGDQLFASYNNEFESTVGTSLRNFQTTMTEINATNDTTAYNKALDVMRTGLSAAKQYDQNLRSRLVAAGVPQATLDAWDKTRSLQYKAIEDATTGDQSIVATNLTTMKNMQEKLGIDAMTAAPVWSMFKEMVGPMGAAQFFDGNVASKVSPQLISKLKSDLANTNPGALLDPQNSGKIFADVQAIVKGNANLQSMDPTYAKNYITNFLTNFHGTFGGNIAKGTYNDDDVTGYTNTMANLSQAGMTVGPGVASFNSLRTLSQSIFSPSSIQAASKINYNDNPNALASVVGGRAAAEHTLQVADSTLEDASNPNGILKLQLNPTTGRYQVVADRAAYDAYHAQYAGGMSSYSLRAQRDSFDNYTRKANDPNSQFAQVANIKNSALDFLSATRGVDTNIPNTVSDRDLRTFYSTGKMSPQMQDAVTKAQSSGGPTAGKNHDKIMQDLDSEQQSFLGGLADKLPANAAEGGDLADAVKAAANKYHIPPAGFAKMIEIESSNNPNADDMHGHLGLGQFDEATAKRYGLIGPNGEDYRKDTGKSLDAAAHYLSDLYNSHNNSWHSALQLYGTLASNPRAKPGVHDKQVMDLLQYFIPKGGQ